MGNILIQNQQFDIDCVIFDKDGTLIELDGFWGLRTQNWVDLIAGSLKLDSNFKSELFDLLGYSESQNHVRFESPLAVASMETLYALTGGMIYKTGVLWHEARRLAEECAQSTLLAEFLPDEIHPKGDLIHTLQGLRVADIQIAVVTNDDRQITETTLSYLGIRELVNIMVCGDDLVPNKPAPDAVRLITEQLKIEPHRMMMVGDSLNDMVFAANAGIAFRVGCSSDPETAAILADNANAIIRSIDEIGIDE